MIALDFTKGYCVSVTMTAGSADGFANIVVSTPDGDLIGYVRFEAWGAFIDAVHPAAEPMMHEGAVRS